MTALLVLAWSASVLAALVAGAAIGIAASRGKVLKAEADAMDSIYARHAITEAVRFNREAAARMIA